MRFFILLPLFVACSIVAVRADDSAATKFDWKLKKPQDRIETKVDGDTVTFSLKSETHIGEGSVTLAAGTWPKRVVLRLLDFPALEGFSAEAGGVGLEARLGFSDDRADAAFDKAGHATDKASETVYQIHIRRVGSAKDGKAIEVELPANFLSSAGKATTLHWIDAYRN